MFSAGGVKCATNIWSPRNLPLKLLVTLKASQLPTQLLACCCWIVAEVCGCSVHRLDRRCAQRPSTWGLWPRPEAPWQGHRPGWLSCVECGTRASARSRDTTMNIGEHVHIQCISKQRLYHGISQAAFGACEALLPLVIAVTAIIKSKALIIPIDTAGVTLKVRQYNKSCV